jgi:small subunit ribosomal protein S18
MARSIDRDRGKRVVKDTRPRGKPKECAFCEDNREWVDYKDVNLLRRFMTDRGKIRTRRITGTCAQHQREVASAIKTARELALLPFSERTVSERGRGRGGPGPALPGADSLVEIELDEGVDDATAPAPVNVEA